MYRITVPAPARKATATPAKGPCPLLKKQINTCDNAICKEIITQLGFPLVSTSLHNEDDEITEYFTDPEMIYSQYETIADAVIDGGYGNIYVTTILDCTEDEPVVVREGLGSLDVLN